MSTKGCICSLEMPIIVIPAIKSQTRIGIVNSTCTSRASPGVIVFMDNSNIWIYPQP